MNPVIRAHIFLLMANTMYAFNFIAAKDVLDWNISPFGFIFCRIAGAGIIFFSISLFMKKEKIDKSDIPRMIACGLCGVAANQLLFFTGLNITTPINGAIIMTSTPILVLIISALILREHISLLKVLGILIGLGGAATLLLVKNSIKMESSTFWGDFMIFCNGVLYGTYLVLVKPLMLKYKAITVMKWAFGFGLIIASPLAFSPFLEIDWPHMPKTIFLELLYVVIGVTGLAYALNVTALRDVSPAVVSIYIYLQPVLTSLFSIYLGKDRIDWIKIIATLLIFSGVYMVSYKPKPA